MDPEVLKLLNYIKDKVDTIEKEICVIKDKIDDVEVKNANRHIELGVELNVMKEMLGRHEVDINVLKRKPV